MLRQASDVLDRPQFWQWKLRRSPKYLSAPDDPTRRRSSLPPPPPPRQGLPQEFRLQLVNCPKCVGGGLGTCWEGGRLSAVASRARPGWAGGRMRRVFAVRIVPPRLAANG
ncbi:hypothetical protein LZ30DRAFT_712098 [Colletotrichum cereale]|nr:hypothetical protein LZ30DRAFT_712098 [Colletotrichum cereale]